MPRRRTRLYEMSTSLTSHAIFSVTNKNYLTRANLPTRRIQSRLFQKLDLKMLTKLLDYYTTPPL